MMESSVPATAHAQTTCALVIVATQGPCAKQAAPLGHLQLMLEPLLGLSLVLYIPNLFQCILVSFSSFFFSDITHTLNYTLCFVGIAIPVIIILIIIAIVIFIFAKTRKKDETWEIGNKQWIDM